MCLQCRKNREEKTQLLLSLQCLESIYCNTQGSSQHSSPLLRAVCWHTCLCVPRVVTVARTTHANSLHEARLSKYTWGGLSFKQKPFYNVLPLCKHREDMLKRLTYPNTWEIIWYKPYYYSILLLLYNIDISTTTCFCDLVFHLALSHEIRAFFCKFQVKWLDSSSVMTIPLTKINSSVLQISFSIKTFLFCWTL